MLSELTILSVSGSFFLAASPRGKVVDRDRDVHKQQAHQQHCSDRQRCTHRVVHMGA